jgi:mono/diheme cytochrome c family protein
VRKFLAICFFGLTLPLVGAPDSVQWPEGDAQKLVKANCLICHSGDIIVGQRLSKEAWTKEVKKMSGWGSPIRDEDREALIDYLFTNFSPETAVPPPLRDVYEF